MCIMLANKHSVVGAIPTLLSIIMESYIKINKDWWWFFNEFHEEDIPKYIEKELPHDIIAFELVEEC